MKLALWVACRHRPFAIVKDVELMDIFKDLNNKVEVPSRSTVSRDVKEIFDMSCNLQAGCRNAQGAYTTTLVSSTGNRLMYS
jgi:hypothetical protein